MKQVKLYELLSFTLAHEHGGGDKTNKRRQNKHNLNRRQNKQGKGIKTNKRRQNKQGKGDKTNKEKETKQTRAMGHTNMASKHFPVLVPGRGGAG